MLPWILFKPVGIISSKEDHQGNSLLGQLLIKDCRQQDLAPASVVAGETTVQYIATPARDNSL